VYGYLRHRVRDPRLAEDLASETFVQAVCSLRDGTQDSVTTAWLMTVARNKLVDHWRREARAERALSALEEAEPSASGSEWDANLEETQALEVLADLSPHHRTALTLRHVDGLSVPEVAKLLERTVQATEALLVRARASFRRSYKERGGDDGA
jgi:RNA polymerase sigma-70 factor (ECF subfamily)